MLFLLLVGLGEKGLGCDDRLSFYISQSKDWKAPWVTATSTSSAATDSDSSRAQCFPIPTRALLMIGLMILAIHRGVGQPATSETENALAEDS